MKKPLLILLGISLILASCQVENLENISQEDALFSADHHAKKTNNEPSDCIADIASLEASLPDYVSAKTTAKPGDNSYFVLDIIDTNLAGTDIPAWCIDVDLSLGVEGPFNFKVLSSYEDLSGEDFGHPENFDLVNWMLNQNIIGTPSPNGGTYNFGHVQWAIWELIDDKNCLYCTYLTDPTGTWKDNPDNVRLAQEITQLAKDNGEGFIPQCGQKIGIILVPDGNKQPIIISIDVPSEEEEEEEECFECDGKITELELQYNGDAPANIVIKGKGKGKGKGKDKDKNGPVIFESVGMVNPGDSFTIYGNDDKGTLGTEISIYVDDSLHTKIHTSCSDPDVGPGFISGDFEVIRGASRNGGELCPSDNPEDDGCQECEGKITELVLEYHGDAPASIIVKTKEKKKKGKKGKNEYEINPVVFEGIVNPGETFSFEGNDDKGTLGTEITIYVNGEVDQKIHTSCSVPIGPGAKFGNYLVISGYSREGGELCPSDYEEEPEKSECDCKGKIVTMSVIYDGPSGATVSVSGESNGTAKKGKKGKKGKDKDKDKDKDVPTEIFENVQNGDTITANLGNVGVWWYYSVDGQEEAKIHTSCSDDILGNVDAHKSMFGNQGSFPDPVDGDSNGTFLVTSHTDENGNTCSIEIGG